MSEGLNKCVFYGTLARDAEIKAAGSSDVVHFQLAVNERFKAGNEWKERVEWVPFSWWGPRAKAVMRFLVKGKSILVEGSFTTRSWEDKEGNKQYRSDIRVTNVVLVGKSQDNVESDEAAGSDDIPF